MQAAPVSSNGSGGPARGNGFSMSTLNVATLVLSFVVVAFAVVTQLLAASGAISLSTTVQLTMWLVALGFIVLLAIAYMFFHVFERVFEYFRVFERVLEPAASSPRARTGNAETPRVAAHAPDANGQRDESLEPLVPAARESHHAEEGAQHGQDAGSSSNRPGRPRPFIRGWSPDGGALNGEDAWVPPDEFRHLDGAEY